MKSTNFGENKFLSPPKCKESDVIEGLQVTGWSPSETVPYQGFRQVSAAGMPGRHHGDQVNQSWWEEAFPFSPHTLFMRSLHQHWLEEEMGWLTSQDLTVKGCFYSRWPFEHEEIQRSTSFVPTYVPMDLFMYLFTRPPCLKSSNCFSSRLLPTKPSATQESCIYTARFLFLHPQKMMKRNIPCLPTGSIYHWENFL